MHLHPRNMVFPRFGDGFVRTFGLFSAVCGICTAAQVSAWEIQGIDGDGCRYVPIYTDDVCDRGVCEIPGVWAACAEDIFSVPVVCVVCVPIDTLCKLQRIFESRHMHDADRGLWVLCQLSGQQVDRSRAFPSRVPSFDLECGYG